MDKSYQPHTPRLKIVDGYIRELFKDELPQGIKYHNADHTLHPTHGVVAVANKIALLENLTDHDRELIVTAAYFHDTGYIREYDKNEPIAARMAGRILKLIGYSESEIKKIQKMILSTDLDREPECNLEKVLCDADLDNLGRGDFLKLDNKIREGRQSRGVDVSDDRKWYSGTLKLMMGHRYHTISQCRRRNDGKQRNIDKVKRILTALENSKPQSEFNHEDTMNLSQV